MSPLLGEVSLSTLLSTTTFTLSPTPYVYLTSTSPLPILLLLKPLLVFHEAEGTTIITTASLALEHGYDHTFPCRMITLAAHSRLEAVGFMATVSVGLRGRGVAEISAALRERGLAANVVSAYFHDHLFVPVGKEGVAMEVLEEMRERAKEDM